LYRSGCKSAAKTGDVAANTTENNSKRRMRHTHNRGGEATIDVA
jgi:hypothetical protein